MAIYAGQRKVEKDIEKRLKNRLEYQDMLGKWYKYQIEFLEYFYPTKLRDKNKI